MQQALSDLVESIIGAIYVSENFYPAGADAVFDNMLKPFFDRHVTLKTLSHHPTKILFELLQAQGCVQFEIVKEKSIDEDGEGLGTCCSGRHRILFVLSCAGARLMIIRSGCA